MTPADLALPPKFSAWRKGQESLILDAVADPRRFAFISAPPGAGKSVSYVAMHAVLGGRTLVCTRTKALQDQLEDDFAAMGLLPMKGLSNYSCLAVERGGELEEFGNPLGPTPCSDAPCRVKVECGLRKGGCHYYDAVQRAADAPIVVTNYAYWMSVNRFAEVDSLGRFDLLVLDEAHAAADQLAEFCSIDVDRAACRALHPLPMPDATDDIAVWSEWASAVHKAAQERWRAVRDELLLTRGTGRRKLARQLKDLQDLGTGLREISMAARWRQTDAPAVNVKVAGAQTDWVRQPQPAGVRFSPVWGHAYAESYLFRGIKKIVLCSATLHKRDARDLGIAESDFTWFESRTAFHSQRRRLIYLPTTRVDSKMVEGQTRQWVNRIDQVVGKHHDRAGIIHCRSYERARTIMTRTTHGGRLITHDSKNTREVVAYFKEQARKGRAPVLVSPVLSEGYDFPYDECRFQIIAKVPFADSRDPITAARQKIDKTYLNSLAAREVMQQVGRGTRAEDDWCWTYIIDDNWAWFFQAAKKDQLFGAWFLAALSKSDTVLDPPPLDKGPRIVTAEDYAAVMTGGGIKRKVRS